MCGGPLTHDKAYPGGVAEEEALFHDIGTVCHTHSEQRDRDARDVHLDVPHPQGRVGALQDLLKVNTWTTQAQDPDAQTC